MKSNNQKLFWLLLCLLALPVVLSAQVEEQLTPIQLKQKTVVTEPQTLYKGFLRSGLAFSYATIDKIFDESGNKTPLPTNIWASTWTLQAYFLYGVSDRIQVEFRLPYTLNQIYQSYSIEIGGAGSPEMVRWKADGSGLGDVIVGAAYQIVPETELRPSFTVFVSANLPTGRKNPEDVKNDREYTRPVGTGEPSIDTRLQIRRVIYPFSYTVGASYTYFFGGTKILDPLDTSEKPFRSGNNLYLDGSLNFHLNEWLAVQNSVICFFSNADEKDGVEEDESSWALQYYPGLSFQVKRFRFNQVILVPMAGKLSSADPSYIMTLSYVF